MCGVSWVDRRRLVDEPIYWRRRKSTTYDEFRREDFDALHADFGAAERESLLGH